MLRQIILAFVLCSALHQSVQASEKAILEKKFSPRSPLLGQCHMWQDVVIFCREAKLLCGLEGSDIKDRPHEEKSLALGETTVENALKAFMARHPAYRWKIKDDILFFFPKAVNKPTDKFDGQDPLALRVSSFTVTGQETFPSVMKLCEPFGHIGGYMMPGNPAFSYGSSRKITVELHDVSLLDALNQIVKADGSAIWEVSESAGKLFCVSFPWDSTLPLRELKGVRSKRN